MVGGSRDGCESEVTATARQPACVAVLARNIDLLPVEALDAIEELTEAEGSLPYQEISRRYGPDDRNGPDGEGNEGATVLEQLKTLGLVFEGTIGGRESVFIPQALRGPLGRARAGRCRVAKQ